MDRRKLIKLFGATSAFPIAIGSVSQTDKTQSAMPDELMYWIVYRFDVGVEDFIFPGIYTFEIDAKRHVERIESMYPCCGCTRQPHSWLVNNLVRLRLGELHDALERIESRLT